MDIEGFTNRFLRRGHEKSWNDGEEVIFLAHKHTFFLLRSLALPLFLLMLLVLLRVLSGLAWIGGKALFDLVAAIPMPILLVVCFALLFWLVFSFIEWQNDYLLVTSRRVVCQRKAYRFMEETVEADLAKIQDIDIRVFSPLASLLGYGDMIISTAGIGGELTFTEIASPEDVKAIIFAQIEQIEEFRAETHRQTVKEKLEAAYGFRSGEESGDGN